MEQTLVSNSILSWQSKILRREVTTESVLRQSCNTRCSEAASAVVAPGLLHKWRNCKSWLVIFQPATERALDNRVTQSPTSFTFSAESRSRRVSVCAFFPWWDSVRTKLRRGAKSREVEYVIASVGMTAAWLVPDDHICLPERDLRVLCEDCQPRRNILHYTTVCSCRAFWLDKRRFMWAQTHSTTALGLTLCITRPRRCAHHLFTPNLTGAASKLTGSCSSAVSRN